jgi:hypothetical protein
VILSAGNSYSGTMALACKLTSSPAGAQNLPTCSLTPATLTVASDAVSTSTLAVQTSGATTTAQSGPTSLNPWGLGGGSVLAGLMMFYLPTRRKRLLSMLPLLLVVISTGSMGCGGSSPPGTGTTPRSPTATTAGVYSFIITATDTANPRVATSTPVLVTVQ